jgi:hypothetical protein
MEVHIGRKRGEDGHPEDVTVEEASVPVSVYGEIEPPEADVPSQPKLAEDRDLSEFRQRLKDMTKPPGERREASTDTVPAEPLLELLDELRQREGESVAYVTAARMLQEILEEHGALNP